MHNFDGILLAQLNISEFVLFCFCFLCAVPTLCFCHLQAEEGYKQETLQQKFQRMQHEMRELAEEIGKIKVM